MPVLSAVSHLEVVSRHYPGLWKQYAIVFEAIRKTKNWADWCYCPTDAAYSVLTNGGRRSLTPQQAPEVARIAALAAWRATQGIYRFDRTLISELLRTPLTGELPVDHLLRLPEWCVYVELEMSHWTLNAVRPQGFFAHLSRSARDETPELVILLDRGAQLLPIVLELNGTLDESLNRFLSLAAKSHELGDWNDVVAPLISVLLYLCADGAETRPTRDPGRRPTPPKVIVARAKNGAPVLRPAKKPEVWETGFKLGAALRNAGVGVENNGPRGHIRRAHWHSYWLGKVDERRQELRWLPPIAVNLELPDRPTVRHVSEARHAD